MGVGIMAGALLSHALFLGVSVQDDGGLLFTLACVVFLSCLVIVFLKRSEIPLWIERLQALASRRS